jgi:GT2 family glycosyltransferase
MVNQSFPSIHLITNSENAGFAAANNQGLRQARGRYWMLLNPDTELFRDAIDPFQILVSFMDRTPRAAACGASLFYPDGTRQHSAFRFPTLAQVYMDLFPVNWRLRDSGWNGRYSFSLYDSGLPFRMDHPLGAALLVRADAVRQVGLLDEAFFIYAEEIDWCIRLKQAGWEVWCVPQARFIHFEAQSTRQFREKMFVELWKARFALFRKHYSGAFNTLARLLVRRGMERAIRQAENRSSGVTQETREAQLAAYRRVLAMSRDSQE